MSKEKESVKNEWMLRETIVYLNHGSFGACPRTILQEQSALRDALEAQPVEFLVRELEERYCAARDELAHFVGAQSEDVVFVRNATEAVNTVLRSFSFLPGDEILVTNHTYEACRNAVEFVAHRSQARVVVVNIPFPIEGDKYIMDAIMGSVSSRTRFALIDHVTSPTALVLPIEKIVKTLESQGVATMVDGAHAVGMLDLQLDALDASYYTSNCHKWLCAPKGSAFLHVRKSRQASTRPLCISHAAGLEPDDPARFQAEFAWPGTYDPTPYLVLPQCIRFLGGLEEGGWPAVRERNMALAREARVMLLDSLKLAPPCPEAMLGAMAAVPLSNGDAKLLHRKLLTEHGVEAVISSWPKSDSRLLRVSLQAYNSLKDIETLIAGLKSLGVS